MLLVQLSGVHSKISGANDVCCWLRLTEHNRHQTDFAIRSEKANTGAS